VLELRLCWDVEQLRCAAFAILGLKFLVPAYFICRATHTAIGQGGEKKSQWLIVEGVWEHHENFHVLGAITHSAQLWLVLAAVNASVL
jgi:hypothetical protein